MRYYSSVILFIIYYYLQFFVLFTNTNDIIYKYEAREGERCPICILTKIYLFKRTFIRTL